MFLPQKNTSTYGFVHANTLKSFAEYRSDYATQYKEGGESMKKLTRATFRNAYSDWGGKDLLNATSDHEQYLRTGEIPLYVQTYIQKYTGGVNGVFHLPARDY